MSFFSQKFLKFLFFLSLLKDRYDNIPSYIESKLLPFQREGIRYVVACSLFSYHSHIIWIVIVVYLQCLLFFPP